MKLLQIGLLALTACVLVTVTLLAGYRQDQQVIRWFPGAGIAAKVDVAGPTPSSVNITNRRSGQAYTFRILDDGTFVAPLPPGVYDLRLSSDQRAVTLSVPAGDCLDLVLDFRFPLLVLKVPREGWPVPEPA